MRLKKQFAIALVLPMLLTLFLFNPISSRADDEPAAAQTETTKKEEPSFLSKVNGFGFGILFFDLSFGTVRIDEVDHEGQPVLDENRQPKKKTIAFPLLIVILISGAIFFTFWFRWINVRLFLHALDVIRGKFDNPNDKGEITHFRALTSALSATVGLGNIAGVAIAIMAGGPGVVFWMMLAAVFGMAAKFSSCTLAQMYRKINSDGSISGGPMYYLDIGLKQLGPVYGKFGKVLAVTYAFMVMGGAIGGGNMFQVNQTVEAFISTFQIDMPGADWGLGITMAVLVGMVILGGIKRIGATTSRIVPGMCGLYALASIYIILSNFTEVPEALGLIFEMAFTHNAFFGGMLGVMMMGIRRAAFSNEAGLGSASIAHAAARTDEPVREGIVAMIGPVIDTILICLMTSLVVVITGAWKAPQFVSSSGGFKVGVSMTTYAFGTALPWFPYVLTGCIALFAYSTMISWCYYGERGWIYLLDHFDGKGLETVFVFRIIFVLFILVGAVNPLSDVLDFSDLMILSMSFPNILGSIILAPKVWIKVRDYWKRHDSGEMHALRD